MLATMDTTRIVVSLDFQLLKKRNCFSQSVFWDQTWNRAKTRWELVEPLDFVDPDSFLELRGFRPMISNKTMWYCSKLIFLLHYKLSEI
ncbi:hypothetical protein HUJ05_007955 [Dendroctonus ponderosae]|nr:hypothetical protein HUJ05_007955 [Dendroctonus ponderosae]